MPGWETPSRLLDHEFVQSLEEGKDRSEVEALRTRRANLCDDDHVALLDLHSSLLKTRVRPDFAYREPSDLSGIQAARSQPIDRLRLSLDGEQLFDRMYGAWLGRCAGCALGKPVEGFMGSHNGIKSRHRIKKFLQAVAPSEYPLRDYFPKHSPAEVEVGALDGLGCPASTREQIRFMESDDDIRYTVLGQIVLREKGAAFGSVDIARTWIGRLPYAFVCTAETQAYRNLVLRYEHHLNRDHSAIDWDWVTTHENPYREWIGAQIRADSFGYAAPGMPALAAEFAWRDARISHRKNGIYGAMFVAAMIAAAYASDDPLTIVRAGLSQIPASSRLHAEMLDVIELCRQNNFDASRFESVLDGIDARLGHYHPVHTNNNAALVVAAILLGGHDLEKVITIAVMGGWDTDCNGATAGSICGAMIGAKRLPSRWIDPLNDTLNSQIPDYHPIAISECARRSTQIAQRVLGL